MQTVYVINESSLLTDDALALIVAALQVQVSRDFASVWGIDASLVFVTSSAAPTATAARLRPSRTLRDFKRRMADDTPTPTTPDPSVPAPAAPATVGLPVAVAADPSCPWLVILDHDNQPGALGYHDVTPAGAPVGYVGVQDDLDAGSSVSVTISHELLEMLADPYVNDATYDPSGQVAGWFAKEVCDTCEDDSLGYGIAVGDTGSVQVSDFAAPAWFMPMLGGSGAKFDFMGHVSAPFEILPGGYIGVFIDGVGWTQKNARVATKFAHLLTPRFNSRRARRVRFHAHKAAKTSPKRSAPKLGARKK